MPIIFFKIFNSFFMNGFRTAGTEKFYWITSYLSVILFCIGFFAVTKNTMIITHIDSNNILSLTISLIFYISFFSIVSALPIISHIFFNFFMKNSFPYWYVKYIWRKERGNIMSIIAELPPEIITTQEISFLSNTKVELEETQIKIIRIVWTRNMSYISKYHKGAIK